MTIIKFRRVKWVENENHIRVKKCCASCAFKDILFEGTRLCTKFHKKVDASSRCEMWEMSIGMQNAGFVNGGVVKDQVTKEIIID